MQLNEADKLAMKISEEIREYFHERISDFSIFDTFDNPHIEFNISFMAYKYFTILFSYDRGSFGCSIDNGSEGISLENSQEWYDTANMDIFLQELEQQIELRIPDKFLEYYGWKK